MSELQAIQKITIDASKRLQEVTAQTMRDALAIVAQVATTKYMIPTSMNATDTKMPSPSARPNVDKLTMRTGRLARSLVRRDDAENITEVTTDGFNATGTLGTRVPYAGIHEFGGTIPSHPVTVTDKMRRFMWAMWYESGDERFKWMALSKKAEFIIPAIEMHARPFLHPAIEDEETQTAIRDLASDRMRSALDAAFASGGAS